MYMLCAICTFSSLTRSFSKGSTASSLFRALLYAGRLSSEVADSLNCWYCVTVSCMPGVGGRREGGRGRGRGRKEGRGERDEIGKDSIAHVPVVTQVYITR